MDELINFVRTNGGYGSTGSVPEKFLGIVEKLRKHTLWVLPKNVQAIKLVAKMLKEHPVFKKYDIVVATGSNDADLATVKDIDAVATRIEAVENGKSEYIGTITLTCGRFLEGTSIPEWWAVHQLNDAKSAEDYFQGSFRCKTPWKDGNKQEVVVFDYNPERFVSVMYQHIERKADATGRDPQEVAAEFTECSDIYDFDNGWNLVDGTELQQKFISNIQNFMDRVNSFVKVDEVTDAMKQMLSDKKADSNSVTAKTQLNENDLTRGSNQKKTKKGQTSRDENQEKEDITEAKIRYALKQVYELVDQAKADGSEIKSMYDVVNYRDIGMVVDITGLVPKEWKMLLPAIDVIGMDRAIGQFNAI